eukprot:SAG31_NODE_6976_length_1829_cov_1.130058_1_plen_195_part_00
MERLRRADEDHRRLAHSQLREYVAKVGPADAPPSQLDDVARARCGFTVAAIYALHSKMNHSCNFNAQAEMFPFDNCLVQVVATKAVKKGSEICITYVNPGLQPSERQNLLQLNHAIACECLRCALSEVMLPDGTWKKSHRKTNQGMFKSCMNAPQRYGQAFVSPSQQGGSSSEDSTDEDVVLDEVQSFLEQLID